MPNRRPRAGIYVGTEAVLHRVRSRRRGRLPRVRLRDARAALSGVEQALALIVRAGRIAPEVLVQTFSPDHEVIVAAANGDPSGSSTANARGGGCSVCRRSAPSRWSPAPAPERWWPSSPPAVEVGGDGADRFLVRAADWATLGTALNARRTPDRLTHPGRSRPCPHLTPAPHLAGRVNRGRGRRIVRRRCCRRTG